jgi:HSP20 family protein
MSKSRKRDCHEQAWSSLGLAREEILEKLALGSWIPNIDICETAATVTVRVELPGIESADIHLAMQGAMLRIQGIKREPASALQRLSYYCLERRYGAFDRQIRIDRVVDAGRARATLVNGVLTIVMPRIEDRRGMTIEIPIAGKQE